MKTNVNLPNTPDVSTAIDWKSNLSVREAYLLRFQYSASLADALARIAQWITLDGLNVTVLVASQTRDFPLALGNKVMQSVLLPPPRSRPAGSSSAGMPVE